MPSQTDPMMDANSSVWAKLIAAQADMANPVKTKAVKAGARSYNYEVLADVLEIVTNALNAHGLALVQGTRFATDASCGPDAGWVLMTGITDGDNPVYLDCRPMDFPADPQAAGSKETYARRYALKTAFGLAGVDDDGEAAHRAAQTPVRAAVAPSKAPNDPNPNNSTLLEWSARMRALIGSARETGVDVEAFGKRMSAQLGKTSKDYDAFDYAAVCKALEAEIKEVAR